MSSNWNIGMEIRDKRFSIITERVLVKFELATGDFHS